MSSAEFDQLSSALMQDYASTATLKGVLQAFRWADEAVLSGVRSEEGIVEAIYREQSQLAGAAATDAPSSADSAPK